ncbi:MAG TPA: hypothetical protein VK625_17795, partial [Flavitalea sp.]|nr:hypothetical protein [Flavitalea sp.]
MLKEREKRLLKYNTQLALLLIVLVNMITVHVTAQKPLIDSSVYKNWPSVEYPEISKDGKYILYGIKNDPVGSRSLTVQSTDAKWKIKLRGVSAVDAQFTNDSRYVVFSKANDTMGLLLLSTSSITYVWDVASYKVPNNVYGHQIIYQLKTPDKPLIIENLKTGDKSTFSSVNDYWTSQDGQSMVIRIESRLADKLLSTLKLFDLSKQKLITIWQGSSGGDVLFDEKEKQLAFTSEEKFEGQIKQSIWHYRIGSLKAVKVVDMLVQGTAKDLQLGNLSRFSENGKGLIFNLVKIEQMLKPHAGAAKLNVWSYTDEKLQSQQLKELSKNNEYKKSQYAAFVNILDKRVIRLEQENEICVETTADIAFINKITGDAGHGERHLNLATNRSSYIVSLTTGRREEVKNLPSRELTPTNISPNGKYFLYYDAELNNYYSYDFTTGIIVNLTGKIIAIWLTSDKDDLTYTNYPRGVAGWMKDDKAVLVYDRNDIWKLDPSGKEQATNITNGYGKAHDIRFYLPGGAYKYKVFDGNESVILTAFNLSNKENGFFSKKINHCGNPHLLTMGSYLYEIPDISPPFSGGISPLKAKNAEAYIVLRASARQTPNFYFTKDFKDFQKLSDVHPEKKYNWYTTELHTWESLDGRNLQGILYKPENFDSAKEYPVIFHYYEKKSDGLNAYLEPKNLSQGCSINIPTYVSNGYLVFCPDVYFNIGDPMQGTYDAILSAARYIAQLNFVNESCMGIQGCSFGGWETNYLVT